MNNRITPQAAPLALYIHWPFCVSKCPYCDFNSHVREAVDQEAWLSALVTDMRHEAALTQGRKLGSIFFGGGTPSLMPPTSVAALIVEAENLWGFESDIEITLEANPSSVEAARFRDLSCAGVNRVSLGLQALDNDALTFLGRAHDVDEGLAALAAAQENFGRVSFDMIYARPGQTETDWGKELAKALSFGTTHMSLYQLTIEDGTRFATLVRQGKFIPKDGDEAADLFALTQQMTEMASLPAYEISNHAAPGQESFHNLAYWRYRDYIGIGPGAHGRRLATATQRHKKPENFLSGVDRNAHGIISSEPLDSNRQAVEALLMGLRLREGIDIEALGDRVGLQENEMVDAEAVARMESLGMMRRDQQRLLVTAKGMPLLDAILPEIVAIEPESQLC